MQSVELCRDMINVILDVSGIYGAWGGGKRNNASGLTPTHHPSSLKDGVEDTDELWQGEDAPTGGTNQRANKISGTMTTV